MKLLRLAAVLAAACAAVLTMPAAAQAASVTHTFYADSGDSCRYGFTDGAMSWQLSSTDPVALTVNVRGRVADRPLPTDPITICPDDRYYSTATFTAYYGTTVVDRQARAANNGVTTFDLTLGTNTTVARIDRVVVQVCRQPVNTLPPSYCGQPVSYRPTSTTTP